MYFWVFILPHVPFANMEEAGFITFTAVSHQGGIKTIWLHFYGAVMSSIFITLYQNSRMLWWLYKLNTLSVVFHHKNFVAAERQQLDKWCWNLSQGSAFHIFKCTLWLPCLSDTFCLLSFDRVSADLAYLTTGNNITVSWAIDADGLLSASFLSVLQT